MYYWRNSPSPLIFSRLRHCRRTPSIRHDMPTVHFDSAPFNRANDSTFTRWARKCRYFTSDHQVWKLQREKNGEIVGKRLYLIVFTIFNSTNKTELRNVRHCHYYIRRSTSLVASSQKQTVGGCQITDVLRANSRR